MGNEEFANRRNSRPEGATPQWPVKVVLLISPEQFKNWPLMA